MPVSVADDSVPSYDALFNPVLKAIRGLGGSASNTEITDRVIADMGLASEIVEFPHGNTGKTELEYNLGWARTYLKKYGLIDNSQRGVWSLTRSGYDTQHVEPREVVRHRQKPASTVLLNLRESEEAQLEEMAEGTPVESERWRELLMKSLLGMTPGSFERLCQRLLRESGFIEVHVTGKASDGGIDGHGIIRLAGLVSFPVMFQCKRHANTVGPAVVRDFRGAMEGRADKGLILTTANFTREAHNEATREGTRPIDLIDGELLMDKLRELSLGVSTKTVEVVEVDTSWFASI